MAPLIIIALYGLMGLFISALSHLDMSNEVRLVFNIFGGIGALILPIVLYSFIDRKLTQQVIKRIGKNWCQEQGVKFDKVQIYKNHFSLIYEKSGNKIKKKFRVRFFFTTWFIQSIEWLEK